MIAKAEDALTEAYELIKDKDRWARCVDARDKDGYSVPYYSPKACKWCATGAVLKVCDGPSQLSRLCIGYLDNASKSDSVIRTNDHSSHEVVLGVFRKAIAEAHSLTSLG